MPWDPPHLIRSPHSNIAPPTAIQDQGTYSGTSEERAFRNFLHGTLDSTHAFADPKLSWGCGNSLVFSLPFAFGGDKVADKGLRHRPRVAACWGDREMESMSNAVGWDWIIQNPLQNTRLYFSRRCADLILTQFDNPKLMSSCSYQSNYLCRSPTDFWMRFPMTKSAC